jgi:hypothetical protein
MKREEDCHSKMLVVMVQSCSIVPMSGFLDRFKKSKDVIDGRRMRALEDVAFALFLLLRRPS